MKEDTFTNTTEIQWLMTDYYDQLHANRLDNLDDR